MKKTFYLLLVMFIVACSNDDAPSELPENQEYLDQLIGRYELRAAYMDTPIDLNDDGLENTDFFEEINYCNGSLLLSSYTCTIVKLNYEEIGFDLPYSNFDRNPGEVGDCMMNSQVFRHIEIDSQNETVSLDADNDFGTEFMATFRASLVDFVWEDRVVYLTIEKEFYTTEGEWVDTILYMEFEWYSDAV